MGRHDKAAARGRHGEDSVVRNRCWQEDAGSDGNFQVRQAKSFKSERRQNDLDFFYPYEEMDDVHIHLPKTYKIESVPKAQTVEPRTGLV